MRVRNSTEARRQARANADQFDRPYTYGTDTSGNWRVERVSADRPVVSGWTVVHPGGLETRGGYGTRTNPPGRHWQEIEHGQWVASTAAGDSFVIQRVGAGPVPGGRKPAWRLKYRSPSGDSIVADRDFETLRAAQRFAEHWQPPFPRPNDGYGYGFDEENPRPIMPHHDPAWVMQRYGVDKAEALRLIAQWVAEERKRAGWGDQNPRRRRLPAAADIDISVWSERDRLHIEARNKGTDETIAEWWDEEASQMFDGFFYNPGPLGWRVGSEQRKFENSVVSYLVDMGLVQP